MNSVQWFKLKKTLHQIRILVTQRRISLVNFLKPLSPAFAFAFMAEDAGAEAAQPVEDGPLSVRLESKAWKTRMEAYDELSKVRPLKKKPGMLDLRYTISSICFHLTYLFILVIFFHT
jgi:hypothetical protein